MGAFRNIGKLEECLRDEVRWHGQEDRRYDLISQLRPCFQLPYAQEQMMRATQDTQVADKPLGQWSARVAQESASMQGDVRVPC